MTASAKAGRSKARPADGYATRGPSGARRRLGCGEQIGGESKSAQTGETYSDIAISLGTHLVRCKPPRAPYSRAGSVARPGLRGRDTVPARQAGDTAGVHQSRKGRSCGSRSVEELHDVRLRARTRLPGVFNRAAARPAKKFVRGAWLTVHPGLPIRARGVPSQRRRRSCDRKREPDLRGAARVGLCDPAAGEGRPLQRPGLGRNSTRSRLRGRTWSAARAKELARLCPEGALLVTPGSAIIAPIFFT